MKRSLVNYTILAVCGAIGLAAIAGTWAFRRPHGGETKTAAPATAEALAAIPEATGNSLADKTIAKWSAQVRQKPDDDRAWAVLGDALMQKARETADLSYYGHAEKAYRKALDVKPKRVAALTGMAWVNGCRHEFEKSIAWANRAIALDPRDNEAFGLIGDANVEMGDYEAAFKNYQRMLDIRPDISSYSRGAHLLHLTGNNKKAIWLMVKAVRTGAPYAENTAWCRAQLALMFFSRGALPPAEQTLKAALELTPNNYQVLAAMGKIKAAQKDYRAAIACYKRSIAIVPQHDSLVALGDLYALTGKPQEAEKQYALVETIHQLQKANGVRGDMQIAQFYADHDRNLPEALQEAEAEYTTRRNVYAADTLAWCYYKNGRYEEARSLIRQALRVNTPEARFLYHAGMIANRQGDRAAAQMYMYHALSLNPNFNPIQAAEAVETLRQIGMHLPNAENAPIHAAQRETDRLN
jgi:tetratricopeptide (TPR) repeat protein